jgi:hypothetical protein
MSRVSIPLLFRLDGSIPGGPVPAGIGLTVLLLLVFVVVRVLLGAGQYSTDEDFRIAIIQVLQVGYAMTAFAYFGTVVRRTAAELHAVFPADRSELAAVGSYPVWLLPVVGALSYLLIGVTTTNLTSSEPPWVLSTWSYDVLWHRWTTIPMAWVSACLFWVVVTESVRLSNVVSRQTEVDLLALGDYQPLVRLGLTNALLLIGWASIGMLFMLVEDRYVGLLVGFWITSIVFGWIGLMLPLRALRRNIRAANTVESEWIQDALKSARDQLKLNMDTAVGVRDDRQSIAEIVAYADIVERNRNWPFNSRVLSRFALYLLIPLASWVGGAVVEQGMSLFVF